MGGPSTKRNSADADLSGRSIPAYFDEQFSHSNPTPIAGRVATDNLAPLAGLNLPNSERIKISDLAAKASTARFHFWAELVGVAVATPSILFAAAVEFAPIWERLVGSITNPDTARMLYLIPAGLVVLGGSLAIAFTLGPRILKFRDVMFTHQESVEHGVICGACDYPVLELNRCPECGAGSVKEAR